MGTNLVLEGVKFMVLGMGTVFLFLILMIIAINIMSVIIHKFFPEPVATPNTSATSSTTTNSASNKNAKIAAISAAIMHHKRN